VIVTFWETTPPWNVFDSNCPTRQVLDCIADKWTVLIIRRLAEGTLRFAQLRRAVDGISQKVLTNTLRALERDGIITRRIYASVPPKVEYSLTSLGRSLCNLVEGICSWAEANIEQVRRRVKCTLALPVRNQSHHNALIWPRDSSSPKARIQPRASLISELPGGPGPES
jgi:DNA-binding HxlR family transcriptional regulator